MVDEAGVSVEVSVSGWVLALEIRRRVRPRFRPFGIFEDFGYEGVIRCEGVFEHR